MPMIIGHCPRDVIFAGRTYPDDPASNSPFMTECNLNAERPQGRLRAPQAAGERAGILRPAGAVPPNSVPAVIGAGPLFGVKLEGDE
jgi:hypothetical protein